MIEKENEKKKGKLKMRKLNFLKKMQQKILQGGYQISCDTLFGNMVSMEGMRENSNNLSIDDKMNITKVT